MRLKKIFVYFVSSIMATTFAANALAAEVQKQPITQAEIQALSNFSGAQIHELIALNEAVIERVAASAGIDKSELKASLAQLTEEQKELVLSTSTEQIDAIIAGELDGTSILVAALAAIGIIFIVAVIVAA